jgi:metal transporter CNNM
MDILVWLGILFCLSQSAMFSGLNLAFFSISRLRLQVEKTGGNKYAARVLEMREDANFLLTTILWGNVGINVLLTLLSNQVLAGVAAFLFSTVFITLVGEIVPQAYFSRHALLFASRLAVLLKLYQFLLYPVAKPAALVLDSWLGKEGMYYFKEKDLMELIEMHIRSESTDIDILEGKGALNFLTIDDLTILDEGESIHPDSIVQIDFQGDEPLFPSYHSSPDDEFLKQIQSSEKKWIILVDQNQQVRLVLDADGFLRAVLFGKGNSHPLYYCHMPVIVTDPNTSLEKVISRLNMSTARLSNDVIDHDIILLWGLHKRLITGADILGRLLKGVLKG